MKNENVGDNENVEVDDTALDIDSIFAYVMAEHQTLLHNTGLVSLKDAFYEGVLAAMVALRSSVEYGSSYDDAVTTIEGSIYSKHTDGNVDVSSILNMFSEDEDLEDSDGAEDGDEYQDVLDELDSFEEDGSSYDDDSDDDTTIDDEDDDLEDFDDGDMDDDDSVNAKS